MTRVFVDCEFNGFGGQLISMAMVTDDGDEWYEVLPLPDNIEPWVEQNVIPVLFSSSVQKDAFRESAIAFLKTISDPVICVDWYTDLVHFFSIFAGDDHTQSFAYACKSELRLIENYDSKFPHNALYDARAIKDAWEACEIESGTHFRAVDLRPALCTEASPTRTGNPTEGENHG